MSSGERPIGAAKGKQLHTEALCQTPLPQPPPQPPKLGHGGRIGQRGRGRTQGGERPMGTAADGGKGSEGRAADGDRPIGVARYRREQYTKATCQTPPPGPRIVRPADKKKKQGIDPLSWEDTKCVKNARPTTRWIVVLQDEPNPNQTYPTPSNATRSWSKHQRTLSRMLAHLKCWQTSRSSLLTLFCRITLGTHALASAQRTAGGWYPLVWGPLALCRAASLFNASQSWARRSSRHRGAWHGARGAAAPQQRNGPGCLPAVRALGARRTRRIRKGGGGGGGACKWSLGGGHCAAATNSGAGETQLWGPRRVEQPQCLCLPPFDSSGDQGDRRARGTRISSAGSPPRPPAPRSWRGPLPSSVWTRHGAVRQGQPGGCVGTLWGGGEERPGGEREGTRG